MRVLFIVLLAAGCSGGPSTFLGDPAQPPLVEALFSDGISAGYRPLSDGPLPLEPPIQGGYVMYVGARVKNMDTHLIDFSGRLLDPQTGNEVGHDERNTTLLVGTDGYAHPAADLSNVSNVNGCPQVSTKDVQGQPYILELTVTDRDGRTATLRNNVVPTCMQADPKLQQHCLCTCSANYFPGKCPR